MHSKHSMMELSKADKWAIRQHANLLGLHIIAGCGPCNHSILSTNQSISSTSTSSSLCTNNIDDNMDNDNMNVVTLMPLPLRTPTTAT